MKQYKEIIVSMNDSDTVRSTGYKFIKTKEDIENYLEEHICDKVISICTTDPEIVSNDLFDKGFDFILTEDFKAYLKGDKNNKFVKIYHHDNKVNLIWSTCKKFIVKDDIYIDNLKRRIFHMYNYA